MAKLFLTIEEYNQISKVLKENPDFLINLIGARVCVQFEIVGELPYIPTDYRYDCETADFWVYRHKYTGKEIHIVKAPETYILKESKPPKPIVDKTTDLSMFFGRFKCRTDWVRGSHFKIYEITHPKHPDICFRISSEPYRELPWDKLQDAIKEYEHEYAVQQGWIKEDAK